MYVCEDVGVGFVGLSFGDGEIVDDDIGEFYLAHASGVSLSRTL